MRLKSNLRSFVIRMHGLLGVYKDSTMILAVVTLLQFLQSVIMSCD